MVNNPGEFPQLGDIHGYPIRTALLIYHSLLFRFMGRSSKYNMQHTFHNFERQFIIVYHYSWNRILVFDLFGCCNHDAPGWIIIALWPSWERITLKGWRKSCEHSTKALLRWEARAGCCKTTGEQPLN